MSEFHVLIIEDDSEDDDSFGQRLAERICTAIGDETKVTFSLDGLVTMEADGVAVADELLDDRNCDCIVLDMNLSGSEGDPDFSGGMSVLERLNAHDNGCLNVCITTAHESIFKSKYWTKFNSLLEGKLGPRVAFWPKAKDSSLVQHVHTIAKAKNAGVRHSALQIAYVRSVAVSDDSVLVLGESGVGKEQVARSIHDNWAKEHPYEEVVKENFHTLNCAGLTAETIRAELFGSVKGSYTDSKAHTLGCVMRVAGIQYPQSAAPLGTKEIKQMISDLDERRDNLEKLTEDNRRFDFEELTCSLSEMCFSMSSLAQDLLVRLDSRRTQKSDPSAVDSGTPSFYKWLLSSSNDILKEQGRFNLDILPLYDRQGTPRARGTLFLDEVSTMSVEAQRVLLRFLNDWEVTPVGFEGRIGPYQSDKNRERAPLVRVIAASNDPDWIRMSRGQIPGSVQEPSGGNNRSLPDWADVYFRLAQQILAIAPPRSVEVPLLIEMERWALSLDKMEWSEQAVQQVRSWLEKGLINGNRREIRSIARRAMQFVRGAEFGIPVADPHRVSKLDLETACPMYLEKPSVSEMTPSAVAAVSASSANSSSTPTALPDERDPDHIHFDAGPDDLDLLVNDMISALMKALRDGLCVPLNDWAEPVPAVFSEDVCRKFADLSSLRIWRIALLRAILATDESRRKASADIVVKSKLFSDKPRDLAWGIVRKLTLSRDIEPWLKKTKKRLESDAKRQSGQILEAVWDILQDARDGTLPEDVATPESVTDLVNEMWPHR